jgi:hypothetical protein
MFVHDGFRGQLIGAAVISTAAKRPGMDLYG